MRWEGLAELLVFFVGDDVMELFEQGCVALVTEVF